jgi:hypothetical protein
LRIFFRMREVSSTQTNAARILVSVASLAVLALRPDSSASPSTPEPSVPSGIAATPVVVRMMPGASEVRVGEELTLHIVIEAGSDVFSVPFRIGYDPRVLRFVNGLEGPFLRAGRSDTVFSASPAESGDAVVVGLARVDAGPGAEGDGELCALSFVATAPGDAGLRFDGAMVRDGQSRIVLSAFAAAAVTVRPADP